MTPYIIFRIIEALVVGAFTYIIDRQGGTGLYRWWYGMTHENPLPADVHRGFIFNRATKNRVIAATVLSSIITVPAIIYGQYNALLELGLWLLSIPVIVLAFMAGPHIAALWGKRDDLYKAVDEWEKADNKAPKQVDGDKNAPLAIDGEQAAPAVSPAPAQPTVPKAAPVEDTTVVPEPEPETDPQELVNRFINRGKS